MHAHQPGHAAPTYQGRPLARPAEDLEDQGLGFDLATLMGRRQLLRVFGIGAAGLGLAACSSGTGSGGATPGTSTGASTTVANGEIPDETAGPYPGDGSNGPDVLEQSGIVRRDIRSSFGAASGTAGGVPMTLELTLQNRPTAARRSPVPPSTCGTATVRAGTPSTPRGSPPRTTCGVCRSPTRRKGPLHQRLPRLLHRALAAHPLRGLPRPGEHHRLDQGDSHVPDRPAEERLRCRLRHDRVREVRHKPRPAQPRHRQRVR